MGEYSIMEQIKVPGVSSFWLPLELHVSVTFFTVTFLPCELLTVRLSNDHST